MDCAERRNFYLKWPTRPYVIDVTPMTILYTSSCTAKNIEFYVTNFLWSIMIKIWTNCSGIGIWTFIDRLFNSMTELIWISNLWLLENCIGWIRLQGHATKSTSCKKKKKIWGCRNKKNWHLVLLYVRQSEPLSNLDHWWKIWRTLPCESTDVFRLIYMPLWND